MAARGSRINLRCDEGEAFTRRIGEIRPRKPVGGASASPKIALKTRYRVVFAPEARANLLSIYAYLARAAGPDRALRFTRAIADYCERLAVVPNRGTRRDEIRPGLRTVGFRHRATIAFAVMGKTVTIFGIFYAGKDAVSALKRHRTQ